MLGIFVIVQQFAAVKLSHLMSGNSLLFFSVGQALYLQGKFEELGRPIWTL